MVKQEWEEEAKDRFIAAMRTMSRGEWKVIGQDVVVDSDTGRNFDYQLLSTEQRQIALEIFRLVDDEEEIAQQRLWSTVANSIAAELRKRDVKGYTIRCPHFTVQKNRIPELIINTVNEPLHS